MCSLLVCFPLRALKDAQIYFSSFRVRHPSEQAPWGGNSCWSQVAACTPPRTDSSSLFLHPQSSSDYWEILPHNKGWKGAGKDGDGCTNGGECAAWFFIPLAFLLFLIFFNVGALLILLYFKKGWETFAKHSGIVWPQEKRLFWPQSLKQLHSLEVPAAKI